MENTPEKLIVTQMFLRHKNRNYPHSIARTHRINYKIVVLVAIKTEATL